MRDNEDNGNLELYEQIVSWIKNGRFRWDIIKDLEGMGFSLLEASEIHDRIKFDLYPSYAIFWTIFNIILFCAILIILIALGLDFVEFVELKETGVFGFLFNIKTLIFLIASSVLMNLMNKK